MHRHVLLKQSQFESVFHNLTVILITLSEDTLYKDKISNKYM